MFGELYKKIEVADYTANGVEAEFYKVSDTVGLKVLRNRREAEESRELQERGYKAGIAPKVGKRIYAFTDFDYGFFTQIAEVTYGGNYWDNVHYERWVEIVHAFKREFGMTPHDVHQKNVGLVNDQMVIIDWGPIIVSGEIGCSCTPFHFGSMSDISDVPSERLGDTSLMFLDEPTSFQNHKRTVDTRDLIEHYEA